jgi:low affinity Fe/Cu permease
MSSESKSQPPVVGGPYRTNKAPHVVGRRKIDQPKRGWFTWCAHEVARLSGKPATFVIALTLILGWAMSGPLFGFSDTWQLVVNTATTVITFLMVFLIQNTQNRDTMALQIKLAELIIAMRSAHNDMAIAEELSDTDLEALHEEYRRRAQQTEASLRKRRSDPLSKISR